MHHSRNRELDGVRGLAILLVAAAHVGLPVRWGGLSGVTLFFVLSGYLISTLLAREWDRYGALSLWRFWGRRSLRLLPALLLLLVAVPVILWATHDPRLARYPQQAVASLLYVGNIVRIRGFDLGVLNHLWSLSVEEQFYVVWPLVFVVLMAVLRRRAFQACLTLAAVATFYSVYTHGTSGRLDISTETNAFALLLGCALAFGLAALRRANIQLPRSQPLVPFVVMVVLSALPGHSLEVDHPMFRPLGVVFALVGVWLVGAAATGSSRVVASPPMVFFGTISYALYLWHQTLINSLVGGEHTIPRNLALVAVSIVASWLSWICVERPVGRLRGPLQLDRPSRRQQRNIDSRRTETAEAGSVAPGSMTDSFAGRP